MENSGVAFGIPIAGWWMQLVLLPVVLWLWWREPVRSTSGLILVIIGGAMNLGERIAFGSVTDMLEVPVIHLWVNWADILITVGTILYIIQIIRHH